MAAAPQAASITTAPRRAPAWRRFARLFSHHHLALLGLVIVALTVIVAVFAGWLVPFDPTQILVGPRLGGPSASNWLGTDQLGRDLFSRMLMGSRIALEVAIASLAVALSLGIALGLLAGNAPRWLENTLLLVFDSIRSFPVIIFALALVTLTGPSLYAIVIVVAVTSTPIYARIVRTQTQSILANEFILAERAMGASNLRILGVHVLPNVLGPLLILASMDVPLVITLEAGLSFLGLGVRPPTPSWGSILNDGYSYLRDSPWPLIAGGAPLILTTIGFTFLGEGLRDIFDPKLRKDL